MVAAAAAEPSTSMGAAGLAPAPAPRAGIDMPWSRPAPGTLGHPAVRPRAPGGRKRTSMAPVFAAGTAGVAVLLFLGHKFFSGSDSQPATDVTYGPAPVRPIARPLAPAGPTVPRANAAGSATPKVAPGNGLPGLIVTNAVPPLVRGQRVASKNAKPSTTLLKRPANKGPVVVLTKQVEPAPIIPPYVSNLAPQSPASTYAAIPQARVDLPSPGAFESQAPIQAVPDNGGYSTTAASSAGGPLNPDYAGARNDIRVSPARNTLADAPISSAQRADSSEALAENAMSHGDQANAIQNLDSAIDAGGSDIAFRYQSRAELRMQQGDYANAASDFQTAILAYRDQIQRGDQVDLARSGLQTCQTGLQMAESKRQPQG